MAPRWNGTDHLLTVGLASAAAISVLCYWYFTSLTPVPTTKTKKKELPGTTTTDHHRDDENIDRSVTHKKPTASTATNTKESSVAATSTPTKGAKPLEERTPLTKNTNKDEKVLHEKIEELDKKGKVLFKNKQYLEAAEVFTEALNLIQAYENTEGGDHYDSSSTLFRQIVTLMNNRSAMYEKASMNELALEDCDAILEKEVHHSKARLRKLRLLEAGNRWHDALVEVCAIHLLFMQQNRDKLRLGLPIPPPPVPQSKMDELMSHIAPLEMEQHLNRLNTRKGRPIPSDYTILQLLKSYTGFNQWMAQAAKDGTVDQISAKLQDEDTVARRASLLMKRGRRHMYDRRYQLASDDFEAAFSLVDQDPQAQEIMENDEYARLLEWTGLARHFRYELDAAMTCYRKCADLEPTNALLLVKQAGVQMDAGKHDEALKLFDTALGLDPASADALFHRSNLYMLQSKAENAKTDLENCVKLRPNHVMARLRLSSILAAMNDSEGATKQLDEAERAEPRLSDVQSYRGELYFTQNDMERALEQFEKAIELDPSNPTPYVNAGLALLNTPPPPGQTPDAVRVMQFFEKAIGADPQFAAAYIQLGQLKLGTATDLKAARKVIDLYDEGLANCRSPEEVKELCNMRILAVAQVEAAQTLKMETFFLQ